MQERADGGTIPGKREDDPFFVHQQTLEETGSEAGRIVGEEKLSREDGRLHCEAGPKGRAGEETKEQQGEEETQGEQKLLYLLSAILDKAASMEVITHSVVGAVRLQELGVTRGDIVLLRVAQQSEMRIGRRGGLSARSAWIPVCTWFGCPVGEVLFSGTGG